MRSAGFLLTLLFGAVSLGCRAMPPNYPTPKSVVLPLAERQLVAPDASAIPVSPAQLGTADPLPPVGYYKLGAEECRQLACENSSVGNLITVAASPSSNALHGHAAAFDRVRTGAGRFLAQEARNRTAGAALALYYKLLELELQTDALSESLTELDALIKANDELAKRGFKPLADAFELKKQRIDLLAERVRLQSGIQKVNGELKSLLAIDGGTPGRILPADPVAVVPDPLDPEQAVQLGLLRRADLNLLRWLANTVDHRTLQAVRSALIGVAPPLAAVVQSTEHLIPALLPYISAIAKAEVAAARSMILGLLKDREREAAKEIRAAAEDWESARKLVAIARQRLDLHTTRAAELKKQMDAGQAVEGEYRKAQLEMLKAKSELNSEIVKWKLADMKAREAMGLLCGPESGCGS